MRIITQSLVTHQRKVEANGRFLKHKATYALICWFVAREKKARSQRNIHHSVCKINMTMGDGCPAQGVTACCVLANAWTEVVCTEICLYNHL